MVSNPVIIIKAIMTYNDMINIIIIHLFIMINNTNLIAPGRMTFFSLWPESDTLEPSSVIAVSGRREDWICLLDSSIDINIPYILYV